MTMGGVGRFLEGLRLFSSRELSWKAGEYCNRASFLFSFSFFEILPSTSCPHLVSENNSACTPSNILFDTLGNYIFTISEAAPHGNTWKHLTSVSVSISNLCTNRKQLENILLSGLGTCTGSYVT